MPIDLQQTLQAIQTLRFLPDDDRTEYYDSVIDPLLADNAAAIDVANDPATLGQWLQIQAATIDFAVEGITEITYELSERFPKQLQEAITVLAPEQQIRLQRLLKEFQGEENLPEEIIEREEARRASIFSDTAGRLTTSPPSVTGIFGDFVGASVFTSARGFQAIHGTFTLFNSDGATLDSFTANTGGGARNFRTTNGPLPPGVYRVSNHRANRTTAGMVLNSVGYSFDLDSAEGTQVFGRSLFRIHPDGRSPGTNGCLGVRENAERLQQCESRLVDLLRRTHGFKISVRF